MLFPPKDLPEENEFELSIEEIFNKSNKYLLGRDDTFGFRFIRDNENISIFQRMCDHEGTSLDNSSCIKNSIRCPLHGKTFRPLATFDINSKGLIACESSFHKFDFKNNIIHISLKNNNKMS